MKTKQLKYDLAYLKMARTWSELSYCKKKQVGALIVKDKMIISDGYNGTPSGDSFENNCEDENEKTQWFVMHAEANAILKIAKSNQNSDGSTLYITCSPCKDCSKLILQSGIKRVVYIDNYKDLDGIDVLKKAGVQVERLDAKNLPHKRIRSLTTTNLHRLERI
jgi:dCMP deaminase